MKKAKDNRKGAGRGHAKMHDFSPKVRLARERERKEKQDLANRARKNPNPPGGVEAWIYGCERCCDLGTVTVAGITTNCPDCN